MMTMDSTKRRFYGISLNPEDRGVEIGEAIARLALFNESDVVVMPYLPRDLYGDVLQAFMSGAITVQQAVTEIQNRVMLWLIE